MGGRILNSDLHLIAFVKLLVVPGNMMLDLLKSGEIMFVSKVNYVKFSKLYSLKFTEMIC